MTTISHWCGRFGNNIQQLSNAIFFCEQNQIHFKMPEHYLVENINIKFGEKEISPNPFFFYNKSITNQGGPHFPIDLDLLRKQRKKTCLKYIKPFLKLKDDNELDSETLVIHVRSGDIFSRENYYCPVISRYLQAPKYFYEKIIKEYKKVFIITEEDKKNPVLAKLENNKNVKILTPSLEESIKILLKAKNLATSGVSSFPVACGLLSLNLEKFYTTNLFLEEIINYKDLEKSGIEIILEQINLNQYINFNEWLNTPEQRKLMIDYEQ